MWWWVQISYILSGAFSELVTSQAEFAFWAPSWFPPPIPSSRKVGWRTWSEAPIKCKLPVIRTSVSWLEDWASSSMCRTPSSTEKGELIRQSGEKSWETGNRSVIFNKMKYSGQGLIPETVKIELDYCILGAPILIIPGYNIWCVTWCQVIWFVLLPTPQFIMIKDILQAEFWKSTLKFHYVVLIVCDYDFCRFKWRQFSYNFEKVCLLNSILRVPLHIFCKCSLHFCREWLIF